MKIKRGKVLFLLAAALVLALMLAACADDAYKGIRLPAKDVAKYEEYIAEHDLMNSMALFIETDETLSYDLKEGFFASQRGRASQDASLFDDPEYERHFIVPLRNEKGEIITSVFLATTDEGELADGGGLFQSPDTIELFSSDEKLDAFIKDLGLSDIEDVQILHYLPTTNVLAIKADGEEYAVMFNERLDMFPNEQPYKNGVLYTMERAKAFIEYKGPPDGGEEKYGGIADWDRNNL